MQSARRRRPAGGRLDLAPAPTQFGRLGGERMLGRADGGGAQHETARFAEFRGHAEQAGALGRRNDPARGGDAVAAGMVDQQMPWQADVGAEFRALLAERRAAELDHDRFALVDRVGDVAAARRQPAGVAGAEQAGAGQADIDERRLQRPFDTDHPAEIDIADQAAVRVAVDQQLDQAAPLDQRRAGLADAALDQHLIDHRSAPSGASTRESRARPTWRLFRTAAGRRRSSTSR